MADVSATVAAAVMSALDCGPWSRLAYLFQTRHFSRQLKFNILGHVKIWLGMLMPIESNSFIDWIFSLRSQ
jgi:hypothetical protein